MIGSKTPKPTKAEGKRAYQIVTDRDCDTCQRCLRDCGPVARDHRRNRSQGGLTLASNLQLLGLRCHEWKTAAPVAAAREGWAVPGWADPRSFPAARWVPSEFGTWRLVWVLYDNDGGWVEISPIDATRRMRGQV